MRGADCVSEFFYKESKSKKKILSKKKIFFFLWEGVGEGGL